MFADRLGRSWDLVLVVRQILSEHILPAEPSGI